MHSPLIEQFLIHVKNSEVRLPFLDLACGRGRNGLFCASEGYPVTFADKNADALTLIEQQVDNGKAKFWQVDLETQNSSILPSNTYSALLVFRYLHRPLIAQMKSAVVPGGYMVYETFTVDNRQFGRPNNTDFLLNKGELFGYFSGWQVLYSFEGECQSETSHKKQAIAQIIARKPE